jgi:hypothetical protein
MSQEHPNAVQIISTICDHIQNNPAIDELKYLLPILESTVKKHQNLVRDEICKESNCEIFAKLITTSPSKEVREKMMSLIQLWAFMYNDVRYSAMQV